MKANFNQTGMSIEKVNTLLNKVVYNNDLWQSSILDGRNIIIRPTEGRNAIHNMSNLVSFADGLKLNSYCSNDSKGVFICIF